MNAEKRGRLKEAAELLEQAKNIVESVRDDESEALGNLPEGLRDSENGGKIQTAIDVLENADSSIQDALDSIEEASE